MNAIINTTAVERVTAGAALLDEHWPDWWMEVDLSTLDLSSPCNCVLGQLGCDYTAVENHFPLTVPEEPVRDGFNLFETAVFPYLGMGWQDTIDYGFEAQSWNGVSYDALQAAWVDVITERRLAASVI